MARRVYVELIADASRFERGFKQAAASGQAFSGTIHRSFGLATSALIGGSGFVYALREVTKAARDHQVAEGQVRAAVKASGQAFGAVSAQIDRFAKQQGALGFADPESLKAFTLAFRATKDVTKATELAGLAANVARGRNMGLVQSTQLLVRVQAGQVGSLRRLGIEVAKGATGTQALAQVQKQYAGAAQAYAHSAAGAQALFNVALHNTEITIGQQLQPTITHYLQSATKWLSQSKNQARIQHDVADAVRVGTQAIHGLAKGIQLATKVITPIVQNLGGVEHAVELAFGVAAVTKVLRFKKALQGLIGVEATAAAGAGGVGGGGFMPYRPGVKGIGDRVGRFGAYTFGGISDQLPYRITEVNGRFYYESRNPDGKWVNRTEISREMAIQAGYKPKKPRLPTLIDKIPAVAGGIPRGGGGPAAQTSVPRKLHIAELNAQLTGTLSDDLHVAKQEEAFFRAQLKLAQKGSKTYETVLGQLVQAHQAAETIQGQIASENQRHADAMKAARDKAARATAKGVSEAAKAALEISKALLGAIPFKLHAGRNALFGGGTLGKATGPLTPGYTAASSTKLTAGLNLDHATRVELEQRYAQAGMHHGRVPSGPSAFGQPVHINNVNVYGVQDAKQLLAELRKLGSYGSASTRGRHGGHNLALT